LIAHKTKVTNPVYQGEQIMKKTILMSMGILLVCSMSQADWNEGYPNKMHYPQLPKEGGWDVAMPSQWPMRIADDWQCSQTGLVSDIHFWVSWEANDVQPITGFTVRICSDDPYRAKRLARAE